MKISTIITNAIVIFVSLIVYVILENTFDYSLLQFSSWGLIIPLYCVYVNHRNTLHGTYLRISYLFIISYIIVFAQANIDLILGFKTVSNPIFCNKNVINSCSLLVLMGASSYAIGNCLGVEYKHRDSKYLHTLKPISQKGIWFQKIAILVFVCLFLYYNVSDILSGSFVYSEDAMSEKAGSLSNYSNVMVLVLTFTLIATYIYNSRITNTYHTIASFLKSNGVLINAAVFLYLCFVFMTGDRGPIICVCLAYTIGIVLTCNIKIRLISALILIVFGGAVLTTIGYVRKQNNLVTVADIISASNALEKNTVLPFTVELSRSYNTLTYAKDRIPRVHDYYYGKIVLRETAFSVPFLYRVVPFVLSDKSYENSSTALCTYYIQGANRTYGNGSSILSAFYIDYGLFGILIGMFLLGRLLNGLDFILYKGENIYILLAAVVFFSYAVYINRSSYVMPLYYIIPSLVILFISKKIM